MLGGLQPRPPQGFSAHYFSPNDQPIPGNGLAILVHKSLSYRDLPITSPLQAQACMIGLRQILTICNLYVSPNEDLRQQDLDNLVTQLMPPFIIVGDINGKNAMWGGNTTDNRGQIVEQIMLDHNLGLLNTGSFTHHHTQTNTSSAIDISLCTADILHKFSWRTHEDLCGSDHYPVLIEEHQRCPVARESRYILKKANWKLFEEQTAINDFQENSNINTRLEHAISIIKEAANASIPRSSTSEPKYRVPWWCDEIRRVNWKRKSALRRFQRSGAEVDKLSYIRWCTIAQEVKIQAAKESWQEYVSKLNVNTPMSKIWSRFRKMDGRYSQQHPPMLSDGTNLTSDPQAVAELLATHFENVSSSNGYSEEFKRLKRTCESNRLNFRTNLHIPYNDPITLRELSGTLQQCKNSAPGEDEISYQMLRHLHPSATAMILAIFNQIWLTHCYPEQWRRAIVLAFPKPGKPPSEPSSYRPIALTSCLGKLMEKIVNIRLMNHLEANSLLAPTQYGYRKMLSAPDALNRLASVIQEAFARHEHLLCVFFDMRKAYDTTWNYGILRKMHQIGIRGHLAYYIQNFLKDRRFFTKVGQYTSSLREQEEGVPQGSVMSCCLFALAINDITANLPRDVQQSLYVDDFMIYSSSAYLPVLERRMQVAVNRVARWTSDNGFTINDLKTEAVLFNRKRGHGEPNLTLNGRMITFKPHVKFLGMIFDKKLKWKEHISKLKTDCMKRMQIIQSVASTDWGADRTTLLRLYKAIVRSKLDYGCTVYSSAPNYILNTLDAVHNRGIRIATGAFKSSPVKSLYAESGEPPLKVRRTQLILQYFAHIELRPSSPTYQNIHKFDQAEAPAETFACVLRETLENLNLVDIRVSPVKISDLPIWNISHELFCSEFTCLKKDEYYPEELRGLFSEHLESIHGDSNHIYTDGSKTIDSVGCAAVSSDQCISRKLRKDSSIYTAELSAIVDAMTIIDNSNSTNFTIFSDSRSALQGICQYNNNHPIVLEIMNWLVRLSARQKIVRLCWVPAHVNIHGNHKADAEARRAAATGTQPYNRSLPHRDYFRSFREKTLSQWSTLWAAEPPSNKLRSIKDTTKPWSSSSQPNRRTEITLARLRIGHSRLTHGYLMERGLPPQCEACDEPLTIKHLLAECIENHFLRIRMFPASVNLTTDDTLKLILSEQPNSNYDVDRLLSFLRESNINDIV